MLWRGLGRWGFCEGGGVGPGGWKDGGGGGCGGTRGGVCIGCEKESRCGYGVGSQDDRRRG